MTALKEEVVPASFVDSGKMNIDDDAVRDNINILLGGTLASCVLTPYIALEKARKVLAYFHIHLPAIRFMEGDHGVQVFDAEQFGTPVGMTNDGKVVTKTVCPYSIYFEYKQNDNGMFNIFCEIVTQDELDDLINDDDEDME